MVGRGKRSTFQNASEVQIEVKRVKRRKLHMKNDFVRIQARYVFKIHITLSFTERNNQGRKRIFTLYITQEVRVLIGVQWYEFFGYLNMVADSGK